MNQRLTIWQVGEHPRALGGIEQNLLALAHGLRRRGHRQALVHRADEPVDSDWKAAFDALHPVAEETDLERLAETHPPDVIVVQRPFEPWMIRKLLAMGPVVRVVHDHDLVCPRRHKYFPLSQAICARPAGFACLAHGCFIGRGADGGLTVNSVRERLDDIAAHHFVDRLIVASRFMRDELAQNGLHPERIHILPPLPGEVRLTPMPYPVEEDMVLFVGQLIRGKGVDLLLEALAKLVHPWRCVVAGSGNMRPELEWMAQRLGIADRVQFLGRLSHDETMDLYGRAAVIAVPSRWPEPFGMVGIEAMAAARPIVAFRVGGIPEWLWHGVNGLAAPATDVGEFARLLDWLLADKKLAVDLGANGRKLFEERYGFAPYIDAFENILFQTVASRGVA
ncbi:MAG: glycosyltransferase family 1 protein [Myxococcales bacterium]|nr:MAG: glycosyltransferase family 1 protein [Myxococcales bacterium]